ncbi:hypothetical protein ACOSQ3_011574 [Xanthoceras sorbifolium]
MGEEQSVCVTGAGGYLASWVVKFLVYRVMWFMEQLETPIIFLNLSWKNPCDNKNAHLIGKGFRNSEIGLPSFSSRQLQVELMQPAITGAKNLLNACLKAKGEESRGCIIHWDEECWSDLESYKAIQNWYCVAKLIAERAALEYVKGGALNIVTVCPSIIIGPLLQIHHEFQQHISPKVLERFFSLYIFISFVDVRDAAAAVLLVYAKAEAEGTYVIYSHESETQDLVENLKSFYPKYNYPKRPLEDTLVDAVKNHEETPVPLVTIRLLQVL